MVVKWNDYLWKVERLEDYKRKRRVQSIPHKSINSKVLDFIKYYISNLSNDYEKQKSFQEIKTH